MRTAYLVVCLTALVWPALFGFGWLTLVLAPLSAVLLLLDFRIRLRARNLARGRLAMAVPDAQLQATEAKTHDAAGVGAIRLREASGVQVLLDWTLTSSVAAALIASMFLSRIELPLPHGTFTVSMSWRWAATLPKLTPQTSTSIAFGIYAYFVALSWLAARKLALSRHISSSLRWLYTSLLLVPGINILALLSLSERAKEACRRLAGDRSP